MFKHIAEVEEAAERLKMLYAEKDYRVRVINLGKAMKTHYKQWDWPTWFNLCHLPFSQRPVTL